MVKYNYIQYSDIYVAKNGRLSYLFDFRFCIPVVVGIHFDHRPLSQISTLLGTKHFSSFWRSNFALFSRI